VHGSFERLGFRYLVAAVLAASLATGIGLPAHAQDYPARAIRIVHGFVPGGAADTLSRIVADGLSKRLGQPVIVDAKPGAGGNIASETVAKATPDGYTLGLVTGGHAISAALHKTLPYQPVDSFDMISTIVYYALVIAVRNDYPAQTLGELIAMAKAKPGSLSFGSVGFGSTHHLAGALLNASAGIAMVHVPYRGDAQTITALLSGDVPVIVGTSVLVAPQVASGTVRALAVTSPERTALLPQVPTVSEAGVPGFDVRTWAGLLAPKGTPPAIINALNRTLRAVLDDPDSRGKIETAVAGDVRASTPDEMRQLVASEIVKWTAVVDKANIPRI
jgi:tripartite-type tricarboxylate transporter receptor subunit TctC